MTWPPVDPKPTGWSPSDPLVTPDQITRVKNAAIAAADGTLWTDVAQVNNIVTKTALTSSIGRFPIYDPASGFFYSFSDDSTDPAGYRSRSGLSWYALTIPAGAGLTLGRAAMAVDGAGRIVFGGTPGSSSSQKYRSSLDGVGWTTRNSSFTNTAGVGVVLRAPSLGLFVSGLSSGAVETSPDGTTWTARTTPNSDARDEGVVGLVGGSPLIILGGRLTTKIITSPDGVAWTERTPGIDSGNFCGSLFYSATWSKFYLWSVQTPPVLYSSSDGVTWSSAGLGGLPGAVTPIVHTVVRGRLFVTLYDRAVSDVQFSWSIDGGVSWVHGDDLAASGGVAGIAISPGGQVCMTETGGNHFTTLRGGYV